MKRESHKTTGEINITIQIDEKIRKKEEKKKRLDGTLSLELAAPVGWAGFAAARLIRVRHLATQRTWYKHFVQV